MDPGLDRTLPRRLAIRDRVDIVKLYLAFLLVFLVLGLFSHRLGGWGYLLIAGASVGLAGVYVLSASAWA